VLPHLEAVLPAPEARPRPVRSTVEPVRPGELICGDCGTGNEPARHFCRRCGHDLSAAAVEPQLGWWQRVVAWWRGRRRLDAGQRPQRWSRRDRRRRSFRFPWHWVGPVLIVLTLAGVGVPGVRDKAMGAAEDGIAKVRRTVAPQYDAVRPVAVAGSSAQPGHPATHAVDGVVDTNWAENQKGDGTGATLTLTFDRPVDVRRVGLRLGSTGAPDAFAKEPRPERLRLTAGDRSEELTLEDTADLQQEDVDLRGVTALTVTVLSVYGGQGGSAASIAELTAFRLR
jgi:hypothetical protein